MYNRLLLDRLQGRHLYAMLYSSVTSKPLQDGALWKWTLNRSATIGAVFTRIKKRLTLFPNVKECGTFLDEFTCEFAEYDDHLRTVRYTHPENQPDDALHATNYAHVLALRLHYGQHEYEG